MAYIYPAPGNATAEVVLKIKSAGSTPTGNISIPGLQNVTMNNSNDVYTWTQLDVSGKKQIATTSTNSLEMNLVVDQDYYFGNTSATAGTVAAAGIFNLSKDKTKITFDLYMGDTDTGAAGKYVTGSGYITGLAPTVSADQPVWVSPITITVDGDFTVSANATIS